MVMHFDLQKQWREKLPHTLETAHCQGKGVHGQQHQMKNKEKGRRAQLTQCMQITLAPKILADSKTQKLPL
eukprot:1155916-Pelagomonas_calceolata.AAC.1